MFYTLVREVNKPKKELKMKKTYVQTKFKISDVVSYKCNLGTETRIGEIMSISISITNPNVVAIWYVVGKDRVLEGDLIRQYIPLQTLEELETLKGDEK